MNHRLRELLRLVAGQLGAIVGMLHLWIGLRQWSLYLSGGILLPPDVRVPLWTVSGLSLLVGIAFAFLEDLASPVLYGAGAVLSAVYILGYYSWHLGGHRSFFLLGDPSLHDSGPIEFLLDHTFADPIVVVAIATEVAFLLVSLVLLRDALQDDRESKSGAQ